jgi:hypothetical protein
VRNKLLTAVSAAALSVALMSAAPVMSQEAQLSDSASQGMSALGIDTTGVVVTADQAAQIENVLGSTEDDSLKKAQIAEILGGEATATGRLGTDQLRSSISSEMASLGLDTEVVPMLSVEQLAAIENVTGSTATDDSKRAQINEITGATTAGAGAMGANDPAVMADVAGLGINTNEIGVLSAEQMTHIQTVLSGSETDSEKKAQIERIIAE